MSQYAQIQREMELRQRRVADALERKPGLMLPRLIKALRTPVIRGEIGEYKGIVIRGYRP